MISLILVGENSRSTLLALDDNQVFRDKLFPGHYFEFKLFLIFFYKDKCLTVSSNNVVQATTIL